jgi:hypothetical protein
VSKPTKKRSEAPTIKTSKTLKINKSKWAERQCNLILWILIKIPVKI